MEPFEPTKCPQCGSTDTTVFYYENLKYYSPDGVLPRSFEKRHCFNCKTQYLADYRSETIEMLYPEDVTVRFLSLRSAPGYQSCDLLIQEEWGQKWMRLSAEDAGHLLNQLTEVFRVAGNHPLDGPRKARHDPLAPNYEKLPCPSCGVRRPVTVNDETSDDEAWSIQWKCRVCGHAWTEVYPKRMQRYEDVSHEPPTQSE